MCGILLSVGDALLGHARLTVIDLAGGRQPMVSTDGRLAMVYNGETYNFAGPWRDWCEAQVAAAKMRAPWLDARQGKGNIRLFYTFAVLLNWLATHPLEI